MSALILNRDFHKKITDEPFVVIDIGARGKLQEPWHSMNKQKNAPIKVVAFEPDAEEAERLQKEYGHKHIVKPVALWSKTGEVIFYLYGAQSSIHKPNIENITRYEKRNWQCRTTYKEITVPCDTLDNVLKDEGLEADFIKCDTQGSEYEIFSGAKEQLAKYAGGVVAETWTVEVHQGQYLGFEVDKQCHEAGFELFLKQVRGNWYHDISKSIAQRPQQTQHDALYFKKVENILQAKSATVFKVLKIAAIAEYYGFTGYALHLLEQAKTVFSDKADVKLLTWAYQTVTDNNKLNYFQRKLVWLARKLQSDRLWAKILKKHNTYRNL